MVNGKFKGVDVNKAIMEDGVIVDSSSYFPNKEVQNYREIVLRAIEKCRVEMSKEMTKGKTIFIEHEGEQVPIVLPDQRRVVIETIKQFYYLMFFYIDNGKTGEPQTKTNIGKIETSLKNKNETYYQKYLKEEFHEKYKEQAELTKRITIGDESPVGNDILEELENYELGLYQEMYKELLLLFKRKNELSSKRVVGTY